MTPSGGIRGRLSSISDIQNSGCPYYSRIVTLFCDLNKSQKSVTIPSIRGRPGLEVHFWMIDFLLYCSRGPFSPIQCHTYSESLDRSRSFGPWSDHITGQKIGKGNAKGGTKPGLDVHSWMIDFPLYCITGPSLPIPCHTYSKSLDQSHSFGVCADHLTGNMIGKGNAKGGGVIHFTLKPLLRGKIEYVMCIFF